MRGASWTRPVVVALAGLSNVRLLNSFQLWEVLMAILGVLVVYALSVRGRE